MMNNKFLCVFFTAAALISASASAFAATGANTTSMVTPDHANIVKGNMKAPGYNPKPEIIKARDSYSNPQVFQHNNNWRESIYSGDQAQMVVMTISPKTNPKNDVPNEVHDFDQFIYVVSGTAEVSFKGGPFQEATQGSWILVPAYTSHYVKNASKTVPLKILSVYSKWDTPQPHMAFKTLAEEDAYDKAHQQ